MHKTIAVYCSRQLGKCVIVPQIFTRDNYVFERGDFIVCELESADSDIGKKLKLALDGFSKVDMILVELFAAGEKRPSKYEVVGIASQEEFEEQFGTAATITVIDKRTKVAIAMTVRKSVPSIEIRNDPSDEELGAAFKCKC
jgi:hypothetical protein